MANKAESFIPWFLAVVIFTIIFVGLIFFLVPVAPKQVAKSQGGIIVSQVTAKPGGVSHQIILSSRGTQPSDPCVCMQDTCPLKPDSPCVPGIIQINGNQYPYSAFVPSIKFKTGLSNEFALNDKGRIIATVSYYGRVTCSLPEPSSVPLDVAGMYQALCWKHKIHWVKR